MLRKRLRSFKHAFRGLGDLVRGQPNARIHLAAAAGAVTAGLVLGLTPPEWALLALTIAAVLAAEAFNTALEHLTNLVSPGIHPLAGRAKDAAAAAVLLTACGAAMVGICLFLPKLLALIGR